MSRLLLLAAALLCALDAKAPLPEVLGQPYISPALSFKLEAGDVGPGQVLKGCKPSRETKDFADHHDNFILLTCEGGVTLRVDDIIFEYVPFDIKIEQVYTPKRGK